MKVFFLLNLWAFIGPILCLQNYVVDNESFEGIDGDEETVVDLSDVKCIKRERVLNGTFFITEDLGDDLFTVGVEVASSSSGSSNFRKLGLDVPKTPVCEAFRKFYRQFIQPSIRPDENTNLPLLPEEGLCPFPKGDFFARDFVLDTEKWPSHVPRGRMKIAVKFYKKEAVAGGFTVIANVQNR